MGRLGRGRAHARVALAALFAAAAALASPWPALAHPAGISSVNRYLGAELAPNGGVRIAYLLDFAEMPAYAEIERLDANHDGAVTPVERDAYLDALLPAVMADWVVTVNGARVAPRVVARALEAPTGQGGLSTLRVIAELAADPPPARGSAVETRVTLRDTGYEGRPGWREMGADDSAAGTVISSTVPRSRARLAYESAAGARPPRVNEASFTFREAGAAVATTTAPAAGAPRAGAPRAGEADRLAALVRARGGGAAFILAALALAFALGAGHAMSPGHGKALVAAYLVGSRGTAKHAVALGATVTLTHTLSVFVIGLLALSIERTVGSGALLRALEIASGALIIGVALWQLPGRWRAASEAWKRKGAAQGPVKIVAVKRAAGARVALARAPTAHGHHDHHHGHHHHHHHHHHHGAMDEAAHARAHAEEALRASTRWREILTLGASGGLVPCPGALVVLLTAVAVHKIALGLLLIVAFSLGLAAVLTGLGVLFVLARKSLDRVPLDGRVLRALPVASSLCVLALGVAICASAWAGA